MSNVKFSNPPLTEVVFGVSFNAPEFSSVHFGLYWESIRKRFPVLPTDKPSLGSLEGVNFSFLPPLRRVWFESSDKKELVQLQSDRFYYNWRKQDDDDDYPHFEQIYPKFVEEWNNFNQWWTENIKQLIFPVQYELIYINQITKDFGWSSPTDHQNIFTFEGRNWNGFLGAPESHIFALQFSLPDALGSLTVSGNQGFSSITEDPVMALELTARSPDASLELDKWFSLAHEQVVSSFVDLIQPSIQKEWGLHE
jgi:uncharacterized protein (TIGR04255 family)